jgi:hypothetical protein
MVLTVLPTSSNLAYFCASDTQSSDESETHVTFRHLWPPIEAVGAGTPTVPKFLPLTFIRALSPETLKKLAGLRLSTTGESYRMKSNVEEAPKMLTDMLLFTPVPGVSVKTLTEESEIH